MPRTPLASHTMTGLSAATQNSLMASSNSPPTCKTAKCCTSSPSKNSENANISDAAKLLTVFVRPISLFAPTTNASPSQRLSELAWPNAASKMRQWFASSPKTGQNGSSQSTRATSTASHSSHSTTHSQQTLLKLQSRTAVLSTSPSAARIFSVS